MTEYFKCKLLDNNFFFKFFQITQRDNKCQEKKNGKTRLYNTQNNMYTDI